MFKSKKKLNVFNTKVAAEYGYELVHGTRSQKKMLYKYLLNKPRLTNYERALFNQLYVYEQIHDLHTKKIKRRYLKAKKKHPATKIPFAQNNNLSRLLSGVRL